MMEQTAENYIRSRTAKAIGRILENIDEMKSDLESVNPEYIPESQLVAVTESLERLSENITNSMFITVLVGIFNKPRIDKPRSSNG